VPAFDAEIVPSDRGGAFVVVPGDVIDVLGGGKARIPVVATFDGVEYRGSIASMGGQRLLGVRKEVQVQIDKGVGDRVSVTVERDANERVVEPPDDLRTALRAAGLEATFVALSYSHQKEHVRAIEEAKKAETRARRIVKCVEALRS
jgi:hypothetical protein